MLKKHNKLILLLVLATFMFTIVGSASAAKFSDVSGDATQTAAIYKLNSLGIIDGYPDGTFGPDKTITRAEFAKIAANMAGLQSVASGMSNTASVFKDINSADWFSGFVNVAAAQGYVKGDPSGNFRPNDQITQGEVITVLMRILGYNDNLAGDWPADYISKAANLEILKNVTFAATKAATRADVASMGSETLDKYVVEYKADSNTFENAEKPEADIFDNGSKKDLITYTLQQDKFKGGMTEDALVERFVVPQDENGNYKLDYWYYDDDDKWTSDSVTCADSFVVANGKSIVDTSGKMIDFIVNEDDEVVYIAINDYGTVKDDAITCKGSLVSKKFYGNSINVYNKCELNDKDYDFADDVIWIPNGRGIPYVQMTNVKNEVADWYTATLNDDGDIVCVTVTTQPSPGIVQYVNAERETISFKNTPQGCLTSLGTTWGNKINDLTNKTYFVTRNGVPAKLADIKEDDALLVYTGQNNYDMTGGFSGVDYFIIALDPAVSQVKGKLQTVEANDDGTLKKVTVNDKEYKVINSTNVSPSTDLLKAGTLVTDLATAKGPAVMARVGALMAQGMSQAAATAQATEELVKNICKPYVSTDGGDDFDIITSSEMISGGNYDLLDQDVTLIMTPNGKVGTIISDVDNADTGKVWGTIIQTVKETTKGSDLVAMIKLVNKEDKEVSYAINDDTTLNGVDKTVNEIYNAVQVGQLVAVTLTGDGDIDNLKTTDNDMGTVTINNAGAVDDDLDSLMIKGSWYSAKNVVVFNFKPAAGADDADCDIASWSDVQDTILGNASLDLTYYLDGSEVKYIRLSNPNLFTDNNYAVFVKSGKDSDDPYAVIIKDNKEQKFYLNNNSSYDNARGYKKGNLMEFKWEGNDMKVVPKATLKTEIIDCTGGYAEVTDVKVKSNIVEINNKAFLVDEDTVVYDATDEDTLKQLTLDDVSRGDEVYAVFDKEDKALAAIVITEQEEASKMGIGPANGGSTTPIAVASVALDKTTASIAVGATTTLSPTVLPANATNKTVTWTTSDATKATVANGVVTGVAAGTATITATSAADATKKATCVVTVTPAGGAGFTATITGTVPTIPGIAEINITSPMAGATYYTVTNATGAVFPTTGAIAVTAKQTIYCLPNASVTVKFYSDAAGTVLVGQGTVTR